MGKHDNVWRVSNQLLFLFLAATIFFSALDTEASGNSKSIYPVIHGTAGDRSKGYNGVISLENIGKRQQYSWSEKSTFDETIFSPKSSVFSKDGKKLYVNSLEGCHTTVYSIPDFERKTVIKYNFPSGQGAKWAKPSGYYRFTHYKDGAKRRFAGKPVESALSHGGQYLWVTFYRRSFDINAQDPSAIAVVDTRTDSIVRLFETGPLPKMITVSSDSKMVAVTHWGDNTVGFIDTSSPDIRLWHHIKPVEIGKKLILNYPLDNSVNRDANSGNLLRGTVFTPDGKWLLVSGMAGPLTLINVAEGRVVGRVGDLYGIRHLTISNRNVYGSCNVAGKIVKFCLDSLISYAIKADKEGKKSLSAGKIETCNVDAGARTLAVSPDGAYLFVACNSASSLTVVNTQTMKVVDRIRIDSYPVGLAISPDGSILAVTSQGREGKGGNALNLIKVIRPGFKFTPEESIEREAKGKFYNTSSVNTENYDDEHTKIFSLGRLLNSTETISNFSILLILSLAIFISVRYIRKRKQDGNNPHSDS